MKTWCEHIKWESGFPDAWWLDYKRFKQTRQTVCKDMNFCPICGTKRPEEPKKLAFRMQLAATPYCSWDEIAVLVIRAVEEVIDAEMAKNLNHSKYWSDVKTLELKQKIRDLL